MKSNKSVVLFPSNVPVECLDAYFQAAKAAGLSCTVEYTKDGVVVTVWK